LAIGHLEGLIQQFFWWKISSFCKKYFEKGICCHKILFLGKKIANKKFIRKIAKKQEVDCLKYETV
jgi:hypothetical protein